MSINYWVQGGLSANRWRYVVGLHEMERDYIPSGLKMG